jgi:hypothetical protein
MLDSCVAAAIGRGVGECFIVAHSRRLLTVDDEYEMEIDMNAARGMRLWWLVSFVFVCLCVIGKKRKKYMWKPLRRNKTTLDLLSGLVATADTAWYLESEVVA